MFDWNENDLQRGKPALMDTPTLIEWIQRQLETLEETQERIKLLRENQILGKLVIRGALSENQAREIKDSFAEHVRTGSPMYIPDHMEVTEIHSGAGVERLYVQAIEAFRNYSGE